MHERMRCRICNASLFYTRHETPADCRRYADDLRLLTEKHIQKWEAPEAAGKRLADDLVAKQARDFDPGVFDPTDEIDF